MNKLWIRSLVIIVCIGLGFLMFYLGKGHTLIIDAGGVAGETDSIPAIAGIRITVNRQPPVEIANNEKTAITVSGPRHTIMVETVNDSGTVLATVKERFAVSYGSMYECRISSLLKREKQWIWEQSQPEQ